ncbi:MAG: hypothetical protein EXR98_17640 [Gemmataceae bacterium]|nr:hypothetical protein [Gemmataceae bacterium]
MYPHRIRLRGPWECEPISKSLAPRRVTMPGRWTDAGLADFRGDARFVRKFGYPGRADPATEHIWLICDGCTGCRDVRLNGQLLTDQSCDRFAFDVTRIMDQRNRLEVLIQGDSDEAGLWGEVALEMRRHAYLADVKVERAASGLVITGAVIGISPQPLDLYVLVDNRHADYRTIVPAATGEEFRIELAEIASSHQLVRLELIHISSIWYAVELPIPRWHSA